MRQPRPCRLVCVFQLGQVQAPSPCASLPSHEAPSAVATPGSSWSRHPPPGGHWVAWQLAAAPACAPPDLGSTWHTQRPTNQHHVSLPPPPQPEAQSVGTLFHCLLLILLSGDSYSSQVFVCWQLTIKLCTVSMLMCAGNCVCVHACVHVRVLVCVCLEISMDKILCFIKYMYYSNWILTSCQPHRVTHLRTNQTPS